MTTKMDPIPQILFVTLSPREATDTERAWWRAYAEKHGYTLHLTVA